MREAYPNAIEMILNRRSIRSYTKEQIAKEELHTVLKCGLYAPSGRNCQFSRFLVLQDPDVLKELNRIVKDELAGRDIVPGTSMGIAIARARQADYHFINHAPTLILAVSRRDHANSMADCACALMNMQLAATALGLASCWRNALHWLTDVPAVRGILGRYGLKEDEDVFGCVSLGYSAEKTEPPRAPRKAGRVQFDSGEEWRF